jgi:para-nitrobenzyl esterase
MKMTGWSSRRTFVKQAALLLAGTQAGPWMKLAVADTESAIATTSAGRIRGAVADGIQIFKGILYGGTTAGKNRFMPPTKPVPWTDTRDALAY